MQSLAILIVLGNAYCKERYDIRSIANTCFSIHGWLNNSGTKSKHMCIDGIPRIVILKSSVG